MRINIGSLKGRPGAALSHSFVTDDIPNLVTDGVRLVAPVTVDITVCNTGRFFLVTGELKTELELSCSRCLKTYRSPLAVPLAEEFFPAAETDTVDDLFAEHATFKGDVIDLSDAVREQIVLGLPTKTLCQVNCPGLCPQCGKYLADGKCDCINKEVDPRLAPLAKLLEQQSRR